MNRVEPISSRLFSGPEIWLILRQLGAIPVDSNPPSEIISSDDALLAAERVLRGRGDILSDAEGRALLSPEVEAIVGPVAFPDVVCVVNVTDVLNQGDLARVTCFSLAARVFVVSWVDDAHQHRFQAYPAEDAPAAAWDYLAHLCDLNVDDPRDKAFQNPSEIERAMTQARQTVLLLRIKNLQSAEQQSSALSWFVSGRSLWLIEHQEEIEQPPRPASRNEISQIVQAFVAQMLDEPLTPPRGK